MLINDEVSSWLLLTIRVSSTANVTSSSSVICVNSVDGGVYIVAVDFNTDVICR